MVSCLMWDKNYMYIRWQMFLKLKLGLGCWLCNFVNSRPCGTSAHPSLLHMPHQPVIGFCPLLLVHFVMISMPPLLHCFPFLMRPSCSTYFLLFIVIESVSFLNIFFVFIICFISSCFLESNYFFDITKLFFFFLETFCYICWSCERYFLLWNMFSPTL